MKECGRVSGRAATGPHAQMETHHRSVDVPEGSFLAVEDLSLRFILFPVNPAEDKQAV